MKWKTHAYIFDRKTTLCYKNLKLLENLRQFFRKIQLKTFANLYQKYIKNFM